MLLASPCDSGIDVWSAGLLVAELALGCPLLPGESEYNQLRRTCRLCGPPPLHMLDRSQRAEKFFLQLRRGPRSDAEMSQHANSDAGSRAWPEEADLRMVPAPHEPPLVQYLPEKPLAHLVADASLDVSEHERQVRQKQVTPVPLGASSQSRLPTTTTTGHISLGARCFVRCCWNSSRVCWYLSRRGGGALQPRFGTVPAGTVPADGGVGAYQSMFRLYGGQCMHTLCKFI